MGRADVTCLVIDAHQGPAEQDFRLAERVRAEGSALIFIANKWDTVTEDQLDRLRAATPGGADAASKEPGILFERALRNHFQGFEWAEIARTTALNVTNNVEGTMLSHTSGAQHRCSKVLG